MSVSSTVATRNFSKSTLKALALKGIEIVSSQAIPAFEGDVFFTGVAYLLSDGRLLDYSAVIEASKTEKLDADDDWMLEDWHPTSCGY